MNYIIIAKPRSKNWYVARRQIGGKFSIIATCTDEHYAMLIVEALNRGNE